MKWLRIHEMTPSSTTTTAPATPVAVQKWGIEIGDRVAQAADGCHQAADDAANPGSAATREAAVVRQGLREPHADSGPQAAASPTQEVFPVSAGGEGGREEWGQRGDGAVHEAGQARLHDLQHEEPVAGRLFLSRAQRLVASIPCVLGEPGGLRSSSARSPSS